MPTFTSERGELNSVLKAKLWGLETAPIYVRFWLVWSSVCNCCELLSVTAMSCPGMTFHTIFPIAWFDFLPPGCLSTLAGVGLWEWVADKDVPCRTGHSVSYCHRFEQLFSCILTAALCKKFFWPRLRAAHARGYTHKYLEGNQVKLLKAGVRAHWHNTCTTA